MKNVIATLFVIAGLLSVQNATAAGCKYQVNSTDKFTKVVTRWTKWDPLKHGFTRSFRDHSPFISVYSLDGEAELRLKIESFKQQKEAPDITELKDIIVVPKGAPLLVIMEDKSITELPAKREMRNDAYVVAPGDHPSGTDLYTIKATSIIEYALDASTMEALASQPATSLWITTAEDYIDFEIHKKSLGDFKTAVECVL